MINKPNLGDRVIIDGHVATVIGVDPRICGLDLLLGWMKNDPYVQQNNVVPVSMQHSLWNDTRINYLQDAKNYYTVRWISHFAVEPAGDAVSNKPMLSRECPCGIFRSDCDYHKGG